MRDELFLARRGLSLIRKTERKEKREERREKKRIQRDEETKRPSSDGLGSIFGSFWRALGWILELLGGLGGILEGS